MLLQRTTPCGVMGVLYVTVVLVGSTLGGGGHTVVDAPLSLGV